MTYGNVVLAATRLDRRLDRRLGAATGAVDGLAVGLAAQIGLLAALAAAVGLRPRGWTSGIGFALVTCALLGAGLRRSGTSALGPANRVTLGRAILVGGVTALVTDAGTGPGPVPVMTALAATALLLDAVDGQVARRAGCSSALGARFDMEVDAFLILVLGVHLVGSLGPWVLATGAMRYVFLAAGRLLPWLTAPLPPRPARKVAAAVQGIVLVVAGAGVLPALVAVISVAAALALLCWSFGRDVVWLCRHR